MDLQQIIENEEEKVKREEKVITDLELNRYQLDIAKQQVKSLSLKRIELISEARELDFTGKELAKLTGLSPKRLYELS